VLLLAAVAVAGPTRPSESLQLGAGLLLLGLGWSCGLIAGSALVTGAVGAELRPTAQGGTDLLMGLGAALAGVVGGPLLSWGGYGLVAGVSAALVLPLVVVLLGAAGPRGGVRTAG
jgi:predicted MFS family arabinose efflux permease